jgi:hypothetical protein
MQIVLLILIVSGSIILGKGIYDLVIQELYQRELEKKIKKSK